MSETIIKQIPFDDLVEQLAPLTRYAFYPSPPLDTSDLESVLHRLQVLFPLQAPYLFTAF